MFVLPANTPLFRRTASEQMHLKPGRFFWCKLEDPETYGPWLHEYTNGRDLKLLDVTTQWFRDACKATIEAQVDLTQEDKDELMFPFGLAGFVQTKKMLDECKIDGRTPVLQKLSKERQLALFNRFGGCMRTSIKELDVPFTDFLSKVFGHEYDGYISNDYIPGLLHGAFPPEVCLFSVDANVVKHVKSELRPQTGGGLMPTYDTIEFGANDRDPIYLDAEPDPVPEMYDTIEFGHTGGARKTNTSAVALICIGIVAAAVACW